MRMGERIRKYRRTRRLSQQALADEVGVSRLTINELENGVRTTMTTDTAKRLARVLGVSVDYLIGTYEDDEIEDADERMRTRG